MLIDWENNVGIVLHDPGGSSIVLSFLEEKNIRAKAFIIGPAKNIVPKSLKLDIVNSIDQLLDGIDVLITGTSLPVKYEMLAIQRAQQKNIRTFSFLDSWINYRARFKLGNSLVVPDKVIVTDDLALSLAKQELPEFKIEMTENYYKKFILSKYTGVISKKNVSNSGILYVTDPTGKSAEQVYGDRKYWGYDEFDCLNFFLDNRHLIESKPSKLIIKVHPSETVSKYNYYTKFGEVVASKNSDSLYSLLMKVDAVVGCSTMALIVATWFGKNVYSSIPPNGKGFYLPKKNIKFLSEMKKNHEK